MKNGDSDWYQRLKIILLFVYLLLFGHVLSFIYFFQYVHKTNVTHQLRLLVSYSNTHAKLYIGGMIGGRWSFVTVFFPCSFLGASFSPIFCQLELKLESWIFAGFFCGGLNVNLTHLIIIIIIIKGTSHEHTQVNINSCSLESISRQLGASLYTSLKRKIHSPSLPPYG